jgi:phosphatidylglycerol:prolipoprotein diacylglycerol transferase
MFVFLLVPWFQLEPWRIPIPVLDGTFAVHPFGLLIALGILVGSRVALWYGSRRGVPPEVVRAFLFITTGIGFLSAMVLNLVVYQPEALAAMARGEFRYPGLSSYGGVLGGIGAAIWFRQRRRMSVLVLGDIWCFAFPFAWLFGRIGCFLVHDHVGTVSDFLLAVDDYQRRGQPRHDLGLYEALWSVFAIVLFLTLARKLRRPGFYLALLPLVYAPIRFFLDFLREVPEFGGDIRYGGLTPAQYASIAFTAIGILIAMRVARGPAQSLSIDDEPAPSEGAA